MDNTTRGKVSAEIAKDLINWGGYEYVYGGAGADIAGNKGFLDIDCTHFVSATYRAAGAKVDYFTTRQFWSGEALSQYDRVGAGDIQQGDTVVFKTWNAKEEKNEWHAGIIDTYDSVSGSGTFCGAQNSKSGLGWRNISNNGWYKISNARVFRPKERLFGNDNFWPGTLDLTGDYLSYVPGQNNESQKKAEELVNGIIPCNSDITGSKGMDTGDLAIAGMAKDAVDRDYMIRNLTNIFEREDVFNIADVANNGRTINIKFQNGNDYEITADGNNRSAVMSMASPDTDLDHDPDYEYGFSPSP